MRVKKRRVVRSSFILNLFISLVVLTAFAVVNPAAGELVEVDWQDAGDGLLTLDTETGLEWLDLTETTSMTVAAVTAKFGSGDDFDGFRYATATEVGDFYTNAGLSGFATAANTVSGNSNATQIAAAEALQVLWGTTFPQPGLSQVTSSGFIDELVSGTVFRITSLTVRTGPTVTDLWAAGTRASTGSGTFTTVGSALVRSLPTVPRDSLLGAESETGNLLAVDPEDGTGEFIGPTGVIPLTALAKDPTSGILYGGEGYGIGEVILPKLLYIIDERTGAATQLGPIGSDIEAINAADFDADGQLWASVTVGDVGESEAEDFDALARINKANGSATLAGLGEGFGVEGVDGIAFDSSGTLWGVSSDTDELFRIDLTTGEVVSGSERDLEDGEGVSPPDAGFASLQFTCDDTLFAGTAETQGDGGDGGDLFTIDNSGISIAEFTQVGTGPATDGSSLGGLALHTTCGNSVTDSPTPEGKNVVVISIDVFEQVAAEVIVDGQTSGSFCVGPDVRWVTKKNGKEQFISRPLSLVELSGLGSCTGPVAPGETETWEDLLSLIDLRIEGWYRSYLGNFTVPGDMSPTEDYWLVVGVVRTSAEFDGPNAVVFFPDAVIDYSMTMAAETPGCERDLEFRSLDLAGAVAAFGEVPNVEGKRMIVETAQCNGSRGLTRRTTHVGPLRLETTKKKGGESVNMARIFEGIDLTLGEAAFCVDSALIANMLGSLNGARDAFHNDNFADAIEDFEQLARFAKESVMGFATCPLNTNYRGNFMSRALTGAFTVHDRFVHAPAFTDFELYLIPADLDVPLLAPTP